MRRAIAILMIMVFGSILSLPLLAASSDPLSKLPACCRANGKHHCMMSMARGGTQTVGVSNARRCPFCPQWRAVHASHDPVEPTDTPNLLYASLRGHPACHAQTDMLARISFDRSRQKRGPPSLAI